MVNDVSRIVSEDGNYSLSIPVVLGESYDDIKASNGSLICNTEGYQKGSSCTYQVSGKASGTGAVISTRLEGVKSGKVVTVQEANTKVEIGKGAHLLLSHGTVINTPETSGEIIIFNSGNTAAASVTPTTTDTNLQLGTAAANPCQATIAEGDSCKVKVDVAGNTNGQGVVTVAYKDGANDHKAVSNVEYTVANAEAGVSFTQNNSNLENALIGGKTRIAEIEIKNTGNRSLSNIKYYLAPANGDFKVVAGSDPACGLDGKHTLAAGASCHVKVEYKPTSEKTGGSINLVLNGEYTDQYGQEHSLVKEHGLSYSATKAGPLSWIHREGNQNLVILSNNTDKREAVWDLSNTIAFDEDLSAKLSSDVSLNPNDVAGLSVVAEPAGGCGDGAEIPGNAKCSYKVTYGPVSTPQAAADVVLQAQYTLGSEENKTTDSAKFQVVASATAIANILTKVTVKNGPSGLLGTGELLNPYSFTALSNNTLELNYTFKNEGTAEAPSFNVATANLPAGTSVIEGGDCPTGTTTGPLAAGASCTTTVSVPNPRLFDAPNLTNNTLNGAKLDISLPYSYSKDGSIVVENQPANRTYAQFSRLWGTISQTTESNNETSSDYTFDIKSIVNVPAGVSGVSKPITVRPYLANPISGASLQGCTIAADKDSCINKLTLPKSMFTPGAKLNVSFAAKGTGMADKDAIINTFPLIIANPDVKLSLDNQYEPVWYTNASGLNVLPGNHGYIHLTNSGISNSGKVTATALSQAKIINNECAISGVPANGECYIQIMATGASPVVQITSEYGATKTYAGTGLTKYGRVGGLVSGDITTNPKVAKSRPLVINPLVDLMDQQVINPFLKTSDSMYRFNLQYDMSRNRVINRWASSFKSNGALVGDDTNGALTTETGHQGSLYQVTAIAWAGGSLSKTSANFSGADIGAGTSKFMTTDANELMRRAGLRAPVFKKYLQTRVDNNSVETTMILTNGKGDTEKVAIASAFLQGFRSASTCVGRSGQFAGITGVLGHEMSAATSRVWNICNLNDWHAGSNGHQTQVMFLEPERPYQQWAPGTYSGLVPLYRGQVQGIIAGPLGSEERQLASPTVEEYSGRQYIPAGPDGRSWYRVDIPINIVIPTR